MTVYVETNIKRWNGLSTDEKPATGPEGSTYHSVDTGETWIYHDGMWVYDYRIKRALDAL